MPFRFCSILIPALLASACSSGRFSGFSGAKPGEKQGEKSQENDEELAGENSGSKADEKETKGADQPAEVSGAFLTVACAPTAKKPSNMPSSDNRAFGCAVIDQATKQIVAGAKINRLLFTFSDGEVIEPVLEEAAAGDPWHVYTFLNVALTPALWSVKGEATALNQDVEMASGDFTSYDPEHLGPTLADRPLTLTTVSAYPDSFKDRGPKAVDFDPTTSWSVTRDESWLISWVVFDLNGEYKLRYVDFDFCERTDDNFELVGAQKKSSFSLHFDAVTLFSRDRGLQGAVRVEIDPKNRNTAFHYLKFSAQLDTKTPAVCLNGINVYGDRVPDEP